MGYRRIRQLSSSQVRKCVQTADEIATNPELQTSVVDLFNAIILRGVFEKFHCTQHVHTFCELVSLNEHHEKVLSLAALSDAAHELAESLEHNTLYIEHYIIALSEHEMYKGLFDKFHIDRLELAREAFLRLPASFSRDQALEKFGDDPIVKAFVILEERLLDNFEESVANSAFDEARSFRDRIGDVRNRLLVRLQSLWNEEQ